ncbi:MAG: 30S ribosomal protein S12 methylthiotransferase RimO [Chlorobi bacterium]|nr:MAG: 30S ribosomal protein S12 methylthiotransferase RimO [Bacteroidota bacterium]KXK33791.1 MAG: 30S ribosomal protein S12P methylthiotransferase [Chlorobi bacterium OLB6]MBE2264950.1 30S ribosomal protein S12 methylthiotransferase RimO [Flavobacteriales bacterium]MBL1160621.1 30S ribosomal protein S12 methylthiotransferase RimO [Chlorobiota bacterium]MBW7852971.1 30S ribosomal protein S12 methylthiotransferase RimO [Candidatus Kapabacteria bacterium]MCC6330735.1 30S ribosomal protein S12 
MNVHIITLGCSKNTVDSETLTGTLQANGLTVVNDADSASAIVINTCGFIDQAKSESIQTILEAAELKKNGGIDTLIVAGCLSARYANDLRNEIPEVDHVFGTEAYEGIAKALSPDLKYSLLGERTVSTPRGYAYLKISEGCDRPCSFCAIPLMRGSHRSIPEHDILRQARSLVSQGAKELILIAQDLTFYGLDRTGKRTLANLLQMLANESGAEWIRCMYSFPSGFPMDVIDVMAANDNICNYLDIPLQHASNELLQSMRRGITRERTTDLLNKIREKIPDITLRSTFIVGYPSETEQHVDELADFLQQHQLDRVGFFPYSREDDTHAFSLGDPIAPEVKEQRIARLMAVQSEISLEKNIQKISTVKKTLVEEKINSEWLGRTESDAPEVDNEVYIRSAIPLTPGEFVNVAITDADEFTLFGNLA